MDSKSSVACLVLVLISMICNRAKAQSSCSNALTGLAPCISYVTGNSSTPSPACCSQLGAVVQSAPVCLCSLMNGAGTNMGININQTLALALPGLCNVQTPPISQCNSLANGPASSPAALPSSPAPAPAPATSPVSSTEDASDTKPQNPTTTPTVPSGKASNTVPTSPSDGNLTKPALFLFLATLAATLVKY